MRKPVTKAHRFLPSFYQPQCVSTRLGLLASDANALRLNSWLCYWNGCGHREIRHSRLAEALMFDVELCIDTLSGFVAVLL